MTDEDEDALGRFGHDLRGSLGSIRMNVGAALDDLHDTAFVSSVLLLADEELRRLSACVPALEALGATGAPPPSTAQLHDLLRLVGAELAGHGVRAHLVGDPIHRPVTLPKGTDRAVRNLTAMLAIAAQSRESIDVAVEGGTTLVAGRHGAWPMAERLLHALGDHAGLTLTVEPTRLRVHLDG
jgi:hypothetical protein